MEHELINMTPGHTKVINGHAVTRWAEDAYEVGTWGRVTVSRQAALAQVMGEDDVEMLRRLR